MKKLIALLLTLSTLFAASCAAVKTGDDGTTDTKKAPDEQTTVDTSEKNSENEILLFYRGTYGPGITSYDFSKLSEYEQDFDCADTLDFRHISLAGKEYDVGYASSTHHKWLGYDTHIMFTKDNTYWFAVTDSGKVVNVSYRSGSLFGLNIKKDESPDDIKAKVKAAFGGGTETSVVERNEMEISEDPKYIHFTWCDKFGDTRTMSYLTLTATKSGMVINAALYCNSGTVYEGIPDDFNSEDYLSEMDGILDEIYPDFEIHGFNISEKVLVMQDGKPYLWVLADPITISKTTGEEEDDYYYFGFLIPVK